AGAGRDHLWSRTPVHVPAERRQRVRPGVDARPRRQAGALPRRLPPERSRAERLQLRACQRGGAVPTLRRIRSRGAEAGRAGPAAAGLRAGDEGLAQLQPARRPSCDFGHRAPALHPARAQPRPQRGRSLLRTAREAGVPGSQGHRQAGGRVMSRQTLLIELGTEELPVKALPGLAQALTDGVVAALDSRGIAHGDARTLQSPRRLAVQVSGVATTQPEQHSEMLGPYANIALDADGNPTRALQGFAGKCGVEWTELERVTDPKGERFAFRSVKAGANSIDLLGDVLAEAVKSLPIPKPMRWGSREHGFARPLHWLVVLLGEDIAEAELFGFKADRMSRGHRFHHDKPVWLSSADDYVESMRAAHV